MDGKRPQTDLSPNSRSDGRDFQSGHCALARRLPDVAIFGHSACKEWNARYRCPLPEGKQILMPTVFTFGSEPIGPHCSDTANDAGTYVHRIKSRGF